MIEKKDNVFKRYWKKIPRKGRLAIVGGICVALSVVPFSSPLQVGCLIYLVRNSETGKRLIKKLEPYFPKFVKRILAKTGQEAQKIMRKIAPQTSPMVVIDTDKSAIKNKIINNKKRYFRQQTAKNNTPSLETLITLKKASTRD